MEKHSTQKHTTIERPPVVVVMGHIDHGKSTLLDYIRKTNIVDREAGGITQHVSAYEAIYEDSSGKKRRVTFLDTPGHESFQTLRSRGAQIADVAILVVSAEDGVKPQTIEAIKKIREQDIPFVVAINKIDKPNANIDRTKVSLAENDVYVEGFGGTISCLPVSAKTGEGISDLLDVVFLATDVQELTGTADTEATGLVIESKLDSRKGITATLIIKNGTLRVGECVAVGGSLAAVRVIENDLGEKIESATFSTPVTITGWSEMVQAGSEFKTFSKKSDALTYCEVFTAEAKEKGKAHAHKSTTDTSGADQGAIVPFIIKADTIGSLEAIRYEIGKIKSDRVQAKIISEGIGSVSEGDVKTANSNTARKAIILAFNVKTDNPAKILAERDSIPVETYSIIYKLTERIEALLKERTPKMMVDEVTGTARILRTFSRQRDKQIIGGKVDEGFLATHNIIKIIRRDVEIGVGRIKGMQQQKQEVSEVKAGVEFGALVESKFEIAVGDVLRAFQTIEK
jgi:translation initiation factor IF-2